MILGVIIGLCLAAAGYFIYDRVAGRDFNPNFLFSQEKQEASRVLKEKKNVRLKEIEDEAKDREEELLYQLTLKAKELSAEQLLRQKRMEEEYELKEKQLKDSFNEERNFLNQLSEEQAAARAEQREKDIKLEEEKQQESLHNLQDYYAKEKEKEEFDFLAFSEQISLKKESLQAEIEAYENKQKQLIARFQKDEELRTRRDFYKIEISQSAAQDIKKLKDLALSFNKSDAIYKLIWEVYYKAPMEALFKKVLGENASRGGIYKITNIQNEKVYVGRSVKFLDRWRTHCKRGCGIETIKGLLYEAMMKDGLENFTFEILEVCDKGNQSEREKYWIGFYKSDEWGYNQTKGG